MKIIIYYQADADEKRKTQAVEAKLDGTRYFVFGPLRVVGFSPRTPNAPRYHSPQVDIAYYEGGNWQAGLFNAVVEPTMFAEIKEPKP